MNANAAMADRTGSVSGEALVQAPHGLAGFFSRRQTLAQAPVID